MTFTVDGKATDRGHRCCRARNRHVISVSSPMRASSSVPSSALAVKKDLAALGRREGRRRDRRVPGHRRRQGDLDQARTVVEGANGFYLEVVCDDKAAEPKAIAAPTRARATTTCRSAASSPTRRRRIQLRARGEEDVHHLGPRGLPHVRRLQARRVQDEDRRRRDVGRRRRAARAVRALVLGLRAQAAAVVRARAAATCRAARGTTSASSTSTSMR